ncbi:MAG TPA: CAP domain-containing protein [Pyrinomonadaceae bacterium]|nr:CAP domain-containing protein [Pyrinomonadaceae bacterium]
MKTTKKYSIILILALIIWGIGSAYGQEGNETNRGIEITYPEDWNLESTQKIEMSVSPDRKAVIKKIITRYTDLETAVDNAANDYLKKDFTSLKKINSEDVEMDGINCVLIKYSAVSKNDKKPVNLWIQLAGLSDEEESSIVLFIGVIKTNGGKKLQDLVSQSLKSLRVMDENAETVEDAPVSMTPKTLPIVANETAPKPKPNSTNQMASSTRCSGSKLTDAEISMILKQHNDARAEVGVPPLQWDCTLANYAQKWANQGNTEHSSDDQLSSIFPGDQAGENLAWDSRTNSAPDVQSWLDEKQFWNNNSATCRAGKACGHYTQIVWRNTTKVGCGINRNTPGPFKTFFVCNYSPGGNFPGPAY